MTPDPRFAARKDNNQPEIERTLTAANYRWWDLHKQGFGVPDLLVLSKTYVPVVVECKKIGEKLTELEEIFFDEYEGPKGIAHDGQEAVDLMAYWDGYRLEATT